jgi:hypothetical protein
MEMRLKTTNPCRRWMEGRNTASCGSLTMIPQGAMARGANASMSFSLRLSGDVSLHRWQERTVLFFSLMRVPRNLYRSLQVRILLGSLEAMMTPRLSTSSMNVSASVGIVG